MPNLWRRFADLLPHSPTLLAMVTLLHSDGSASLTLLGGGILRTRTGGVDCSVGDRVFVRDGQIQGLAPQLPQVMVEI